MLDDNYDREEILRDAYNDKIREEWISTYASMISSSYKFPDECIFFIERDEFINLFIQECLSRGIELDEIVKEDLFLAIKRINNYLKSHLQSFISNAIR